MVDLAPAAHLLLKLSYSLVKLTLLSLIFAFEKKGAFTSTQKPGRFAFNVSDSAPLVRLRSKLRCRSYLSNRSMMSQTSWLNCPTGQHCLLTMCQRGYVLTSHIDKQCQHLQPKMSVPNLHILQPMEAHKQAEQTYKSRTNLPAPSLTPRGSS